MYVSSSVTDDLDLWTHGVCIAFNTDDLNLGTSELYVQNDIKQQ